MIEPLQFIAIFSTLSFAAIAIYISVGEHPARMECGPELASFVFGPSYRRAAKLQASLALLGAAAGGGLYFLTDRYPWLAGAVLIFSVVPITLLFIFPTNKQLLAPDLDRTSPATYELLRTWGRLHGVRSILSLAAAILYLCTLIWP
jgi:hypothetical protein